MIYGFYSNVSAERYGTGIWSRPDGTEVEVTAVTDDLVYNDYKFADKICVGEVTVWLRKGRRGKVEVQGIIR